MVSFVTINYNTATLTLQCVRSILSHAALQGSEIIIVDNASAADDREMLKKLQDNLYEFVKDRYSLDTICKKRVEFYKKLVGVE